MPTTLRNHALDGQAAASLFRLPTQGEIVAW
jgi:hypothetical protein